MKLCQSDLKKEEIFREEDFYSLLKLSYSVFNIAEFKPCPMFTHTNKTFMTRYVEGVPAKGSVLCRRAMCQATS